MKRYSKLRKGITVLLGSVMAAGLMLGTGNMMQAQAENENSTDVESLKDGDRYTYLGINGIWDSDSSLYARDFVYFGTKSGAPLKFRTLQISRSTDASGESTSRMYLDCDTILTDAPYRNTNNITLAQLIQSSLFYDPCLSFAEKYSIAKVDDSELDIGLLNSASANKEYKTNDSRKKTGGKKGDYWLYPVGADYCYVNSDGEIKTSTNTQESHGVSPALLLDGYRVLFNTIIETKDEIEKSNNKGGYSHKLTLLAEDNDIKTEITSKEKPRINADTNEVTIPYKITGYKVDQVNAMTILITDGEYTTSGTPEYYAKATSWTDDTVTFEWNDDWNKNFYGENAKYQLYLIAEIRTSGNGTDVASVPVKIETPYKEINKVQVTFTPPFSGDEKYETVTKSATELSNVLVNSYNATENSTTERCSVSEESLLVREANSTESGTELAKFNTEYQASFSLTIDNENSPTPLLAFAKDGVDVTVVCGDTKTEIKGVIPNEDGTLSCSKSKAFSFTTRKAKFFKALFPTQETEISVNYAAQYDGILSQLNSDSMEKYRHAYIVVEGGEKIGYDPGATGQQGILDVTFNWEGEPKGYKHNQTNGQKFTAVGTLNDVEGYDLTGIDGVVSATIVMDGQQTVGTPTSSPAEDVSDIVGTQKVTLQTATDWGDSTIYYTTNGTQLTASNYKRVGTLYTAEDEIEIQAPETESNTVTLYAIAVRGDDTPSEVLTRTYTFKGKQTLTVTDGTIGDTDANTGSFRPGETVTVKATDKTGQGLLFNRWKVPDGVTLSPAEDGSTVDLTNKDITFKMPDVTAGITLTATYRKVVEPEIANDPVSKTVADGEPAEFSVKVTYNNEVYKDTDFSYQWQNSTDESDFTDIQGETSSTYKIEKATCDISGTQYRCIVTYTPKSETSSEETEKLISGAATLTVTKTGTGFQITSPTNQTAQVGESATFKVSVQKAYDTDNLKYQWYQGEKDQGNKIEGATSDAYTIDEVTFDLDGTKYYCVVTEYDEDEEIATGTSNAATLTIGTTPTPDPEPEPKTYTVTVNGGSANKTTCKEGETVTITAAVPDKQKFVSWTGNVSFGDAKSASTTFTMPANDVTVTATFENDYTINITQQPENVSVSAGGNATFTVAAESSYEMTYEWKADCNDGKGFQTVGAGPSFDVKNAVASMNGTRYECIISIDNNAYSVTSSVAVLTVEAAEYTIKVNSGTASVASSKAGETITIKANAAPSGQQFKKWTIVSGRVNFGDATKEETTFTMPASNVEVTAEYQNQLTTPVITTNPESVTIYAGSGTSFKVAASGEELSYQWKVDKTDGNGFQDISGATNATYRVYTEDASMNGYKYKCVVSNRSGSAESKEAVLTVDYKITEGARSTFNKSGSNGLTFKGSGAYDKFRYVQVDGSRISGSNFTKKSDPTIITLTASYLKGLSNGEHTLVIVWEDGKATTTFTVAGTDTSSNSSSSSGSSSSTSKSSTSSDKSSAAASSSTTDTNAAEETAEETVDMPVVRRAESADESDGKTQETAEAEDTGENTYGANDSVITTSLDGSIEKKDSWLNRYAAACAILVIILSAAGIGLVLLSRRRNNK